MAIPDSQTIDQTTLLSYQDRRLLEVYDDVYTETISYKDIDLRFIPHPITGKLPQLKNEDAVREALKNLILTEPGERPFNPYFGTPINGLLFELMDVNPGDLENVIEKSIKLFEPRVRVVKITVNRYIDDNAIEIFIEYNIINLSSDRIFEVRVKRTR